MPIDRNKLFPLIGYEPFTQQNLLHESDARFKVPCCGRRFGKSTSAARDIEPDLFDEKSMHWIIGPSYELAEKEFRVIWDDLLIGLELMRDKRVKRGYNKKQGHMFIEFPWGARLEVKTAAKDENIVGESLNTALFSEAAKHDHETWERFIRPALADKRGRAIFPSTPEGLNWYYDLWMLGKTDPLFEAWTFPSWANTVMFPGGAEDPEILAVKRNASPEWFDQEYGAKFTSFVGKIYPEFTETDHVQNHRFNPQWPNYIAFDWGYANPMAAIEFQVSPQGEVYIWREFYQKNITLVNALESMKNRAHPAGYHINLCFGDSADPDAVQTVNERFAPCMASGDAKKNWRQGIELVKSLLKLQHDGVTYDDYERPVGEKPRLFVTPDCTNVIKEFANYRTKEKTQGLNESSTTGAAQKIDDHAMDAIRYGMMHVFELGAQSSLDDLMPKNSSYTTTKYTPEHIDSNVGYAKPFFSLNGQNLMSKRF